MAWWWNVSHRLCVERYFWRLWFSWKKEVTGDMLWTWYLDSDAPLAFASCHLWNGYLPPPWCHGILSHYRPRINRVKSCGLKTWNLEPKLNLCSLKLSLRHFGNSAAIQKQHVSSFSLLSLLSYSVSVMCKKKCLLVMKFCSKFWHRFVTKDRPLHKIGRNCLSLVWEEV